MNLRTLKFLIAFIATTLVSNLVTHATIVQFSSATDIDTDANTSGTTPYSITSNAGGGVINNGGQNNNHGGFSDNTTTAETQTYTFQDSTTGIKYSYDVTLSSVGGNLDGNAFVMGVAGGIINKVDGTEEICVEVSNLSVDLSMYISNSIAGITTVGLETASGGGDGFGFGFQTVGMGDHTIADPNQTNLLVTYTDPANSANDYVDQVWEDNDTGYNFGSGANADSGTPFPNLNNDGGTACFKLNPDDPANDDDFAISNINVRVVMDLIQVPEPSNYTPMLLLGLCFLRRRR